MNRIRLLFDEDGGASGATGTPEPQAPGAAAVAAAGELAGADTPPPKETKPPADAEKPKAMPKWNSQLSPEAREKYKTHLEAMGEVSLTDAFSEMVETKGKLERAILMPDKDNPDDIKRFMKDMGIPESPDGYDIDEKDLGPEVTTLLTRQALKAGMTTTQAKTMHGFLCAIMKNGQEGIATATKQMEETFDARLAEAAGSPEAGDAISKHATKFLIRFNDKDVLQSLKKTGMIYNTTFMSKLAGFEKALGDTKFVGNNTPPAASVKGERSGAFGNYNKEFTDRYGSK